VRTKYLCLLQLFILFLTAARIIIYAQGGCMLVTIDNGMKAKESDLIPEGDVVNSSSY
jgi:hypothetical protein